MHGELVVVDDVPGEFAERVIEAFHARPNDGFSLAVSGGETARASYERLLHGGVRIFWYQPAMIHAKAFVVDGCWSSIGTMNFDNRSLAFNDESNLLVLNEEFGGTVRDMFLDDLTRAKEVTLEEFRRRPRKERLIEWAASRVARVL